MPKPKQRKENELKFRGKVATDVHDRRLNELVASFAPCMEKTRWEEREINIIRDNYKKMSDEQIREKLLPHRALSGIRAKRREIGCLKRMQIHQAWTPEQIEILKENYLEYNQRELRDKFFPDKTVEQVRSAKMSRGLKKPPVWTNEERAILIKHGADCPRNELQFKFFPDKTLDQISGMRKYLGIKRNPRNN